MRFPTDKFIITSRETMRDPVLLSIARSGTPKTRRLHSAPRRAFSLVLRGLTDAERSVIDLFLTANRMNAFEIAWCGVPTYGGAVRYPTNNELFNMPWNSLIPVNSDYTVETLVYLETYPAWYTALLAIRNWNPAEESWVCEFDISEIGTLFWSRGAWPPPNYSNHYGNTTIPLFKWTHVAVVYDLATNMAQMYVNAKPDGGLRSNAGFFVPTLDTVDGFITGGWGAATGVPNPWMQDELRVWGVKRTQAELAANMNVSMTGTEPGLRGCWHFEETSGTNAADATPNANHGIGVVSPWGSGDDLIEGQPIEWYRAGSIGYKPDTVFSVIEETGEREWAKDDGKWSTQIAVLQA